MQQRVVPVLRRLHSLDLRSGLRELAVGGHAGDEGRTLAGLLTEAVRDYLATRRVRPAFREAAEAVLIEHDELLARLAK